MIIKIKRIIKNNIFILKFTWKQNKSYFFVFFFTIIISNIKDLMLVIAPKYIFDSMQYGNDFRETIFPIFQYILLYLLLHWTLHLLSYLKTLAESKLKMDLNVRLGEKFMKVEYSFLENNKSIEMFNRAKMAISGGLNDIQTLGMGGQQGLGGYFEQLSNIIKNITLLISVAFVFSYMEFYMFLIVAACVSLNLIFSVVKIFSTIKIRETAGPYLTKSRYCNHLLRTFEYGKEFRVFGITDFIVSKFRQCTREYIDIRNDCKTKSCFSSVMINIVSNLMRASILISLIFKLSDGTISVGDFSMIFAAILTFSDTAHSLLNAILHMNLFSEFMEDYQKCIELEETDQTSAGRELSSNAHVIEMKNVCFQYKNSHEFALKNINVKLNSGEKVSIVGFNGAGKSTFIKLLLGLYQPTKGLICIDGVDIKEYSQSSLRNYMSAVFQDYKIFALTVEENIALGEDIDQSRLQYCMQRSEITEKVNSLAKKEKSVISGFFEQGDILLSGGESQKIAMSRSFYRKPDLIALDEPTSSLDVISEDKMYKSVAENSKNELLLFISHRLASTKFCDRILVFDSGEIAESGTHQELIKNQGLYYSMWNIQAERFNEEKADEK